MTKSDGEINNDIFTIQKNHHVMKDFEDMTLEERDEILQHIRNIPDESSDSLDLFTQSFNELSKNWSNGLKEFDSIYSDCMKESHVNLTAEKDESG